MPLNKSGSDAAFKQNVRTLMGEVGSSPHVQSRKQALAIAYATKRRGRAAGGSLEAPWYIKSQARPMKSGAILSSVPGRTDKHNMDVGSGSYVLPADHVSSLGEGNTLAGTKVLNYMFGSGPYGSKSLPLKRGAGPRGGNVTTRLKGLGRAMGGDVGGEPTPIAAAGGEYIIPPEKIIEMYGSLERGHEILDHWVKSNRKKHISTLRKLPGPAKD